MSNLIPTFVALCFSLSLGLETLGLVHVVQESRRRRWEGAFVRSPLPPKLTTRQKLAWFLLGLISAGFGLVIGLRVLGA